MLNSCIEICKQKKPASASISRQKDTPTIYVKQRQVYKVISCYSKGSFNKINPNTDMKVDCFSTSKNTKVKIGSKG